MTTPQRDTDSRDRDGHDRHDSDRRGDHRYPDVHQLPAERLARQERDDLKDRLTRSRPKGRR